MSEQNRINTGGSAFPNHGVTGMKLRDYFAAKALAGIVSSVGVDLTGSPMPYDEALEVAVDAYRIADAMIAARGH